MPAHVVCFVLQPKGCSKKALPPTRSTAPMTQTHRKQPQQDVLFPLTGIVAIYTRVAASQERETRQLQTTDLVALACENGFSAQQITVYEERNVSGKMPLARRTAASKLLNDIIDPPPETQPIKAIFVSAEDRLFRDGAAVDIAFFIETCREHNVLLVTPTSVYDFINPAHVAQFRFICETVGEYVKRMILSRLQAGRRQKRQQRTDKESQQ